MLGRNHEHSSKDEDGPTDTNRTFTFATKYGGRVPLETIRQNTQDSDRPPHPTPDGMLFAFIKRTNPALMASIGRQSTITKRQSSLEEPQEKKSLLEEHSLRQRLKEYIEETEIHGIKRALYVGQENGSRRPNVCSLSYFVWAACFIGSVIFLGIFFSDRYNYYLTYPVTTLARLDLKFIPLPAITILNYNEIKLNRITKDDLVEVGTSYFGLRPDGSLPLDLEDFDPASQKFVNSSNKVLNTLRNLTVGLDTLSRLRQHPSAEFDYKAFVRRAGHQEDEMITNCYWKEDGVRDNKTQCRERGVVKSQMWPLGNAYTINAAIPGKEGWKLTRSGYKVGIEMWLDGETEDYIPMKRRGGENFRWQSKAIFIIVHPPKLRPESLYGRIWFRVDLGTDTAPNTDIMIDVKKVTKFIRLKSPHGNCTDGVNLVKYYDYYTQENCIYECISQKVGEMFGCVLYDMPNSDKFPVCSRDKLDYYSYDTARIGPFYDQCFSQCPRPCEEWSYDWEITAKPGDDTHIVHLHVTSNVPTFETVEEIPLYGPDSLLAEFGGMLSLFLGASLLALLHTLEFLLEELLIGGATLLTKMCCRGKRAAVTTVQSLTPHR